MFYSHLLSTHITALKFVGDYLLIGEGNRIKCFDWKRKQCIESVHVFQGCSVHGIRIVSINPECVRIVIFGAKAIRIFSFSLHGNKRFTGFTHEQHLNDWIHDVQCISSLNAVEQYEEIVAVVTAHNSVILWDLNKAKVQEQFHCLEKCIVYSASILSNEIDGLVLAAGTVFKEVIIWSPNVVNSNKEIIPFHRLTGHQGVIFSISYNARLRLLCTTSDDRGLRLWKFSCSDANEIENADFRVSLEEWKTGSFHLIQSSFSHESRVWTSLILPTCIISIGEDSTVCFWTHNGNLITKEKCHRGGSIWCIDVNDDNMIAATGGSDSGILLWNINQTINENCIEKIPMLTKMIDNSDFPRTVTITKSNQKSILCTTENGKLLSYKFVTGEYSLVHDDPLYSSYSILSMSPCGSVVLLGSLDGTVNAFQLENEQFLLIKKWKTVDGKVHNIFWLDSSPKSVLICGMKGQLMLWSIEKEKTYDFILKCEFQLPANRYHWWATVACYVSLMDGLIVGDGSGSVHVYLNFIKQKTKVLPCYSYHFIHGKHGVTDIQQTQNLVYSAGRDGRVMCYNILANGLKLMHSLKVPHDLEWLVKLLFVKDDLIVLGFHTTHFVAWSSKYDRILMKVNCGGGHRSWDFSLTNDGCCIFTTVKRKEIIYMKRDFKFLLDSSSIQNGISGMALCCTCYLFEHTDEQFGEMSVIACGGEDPALKFIGLPHTTSASGAFILLRSISGHLSSTRAIAKCAIPESNAFLMVSVGGRAQMMVWSITNEKGLICEEITSDFLWNVDKPAKKAWREKSEPILDPQTRYMDVAIWPSSYKPKEEFCIALACSDSFIRLHIISISERKLMQHFMIPYGQHCVLKLSLMSGLHDDNLVHFASAGNDGNFKIHDSSFLLKTSSFKNIISSKNYEKDFISVCSEPLLQKSVHQSGVNALDTMQMSDKNWLMCSGGDDNGLSAVMMQVDKKSPASSYVTIIASGSCFNAHASQITGVKILPRHQLLSISIDQRLNYWQLKQSANVLDFQILKSVICSIPDVAHLEMWCHKQENSTAFTLVVCGQGLESFQFELL